MRFKIDSPGLTGNESFRARRPSGPAEPGDGGRPAGGGAAARAMLASIHTYQRLISSHARRSCPFEPSCSRYAVLAIEKYGAARGAAMSLRRIMRCNPLYKGSLVDYP